MNYYRLLLPLYFMFFYGISSSQHQFQKKYESTDASRAHAINLTTDSGFIVAGSYDVAGFLSGEFYVIKLDSKGDTVWANTYGSKVDTTISGNRDGAGNEAYDVIQTNDSGYIIVGEAHAVGAGASDIFVLKLTKNGDTLWTKIYGGINSDYCYTVIQLEDSGYILSGHTESYGLGLRDLYVMRLNSLGDTLWAKAYGGSSIDGSNEMVRTKDGGFIIVGNTFSFGNGGSDIYVVKIDANGNIKWSNAYGGNLNDYGNAIAATSDSGFVISGSTESFGAGQRDVYVIKIDSIGNLIWSKTFGGVGNERGSSILEAHDKNIVVFGNTRSFGKGFEDFYLIKLNPLGDTIMTRVYGGASIDFGESFKQTKDKGFIMTGYTNSFNTWNFNVYLIKTDSLGNSSCHQSTTSTIVSNPVTVKTISTTSVSFGSNSTSSAILIGKTMTNPINVCNINSVNELTSENQIVIYPNPTNNYFSILDKKNIMSNNSITTIIDVRGKIIQEFVLTNSDSQIDISTFNKGVYFAQIETKQGLITVKIIKQ